MIGEILSSLKLLQWALEKYTGRISERDRQNIRKEAERVIQLATVDDMEKYLAAPRRLAIDAAVAKAAKAPKKTTAAKRLGGATRKRATTTKRK